MKIRRCFVFGAPRCPENRISFHVNDYIQQQTRAIIDEAAHVYALNVGNGGNVHDEQQEEDFLIDDFSEDNSFFEE